MDPMPTLIKVEFRPLPHLSLDGGDGKDLLSGGTGNEELSGGNGADKFQCGAGTHKIIDFHPSQATSRLTIVNNSSGCSFHNDMAPTR
jgi:hypothetical protein